MKHRFATARTLTSPPYHSSTSHVASLFQVQVYASLPLPGFQHYLASGPTLRARLLTHNPKYSLDPSLDIYGPPHVFSLTLRAHLTSSMISLWILARPLLEPVCVGTASRLRRRVRYSQGVILVWHHLWLLAEAGL